MVPVHAVLLACRRTLTGTSVGRRSYRSTPSRKDTDVAFHGSSTATAPAFRLRLWVLLHATSGAAEGLRELEVNAATYTQNAAGGQR